MTKRFLLSGGIAFALMAALPLKNQEAKTKFQEGSTLVQAAIALKDLKGADADEQTGIDIVRRALEEPLRQIAINAGMEGSVVVNAVREGKAGFGLNALTEEYVDLVAAGVVDPVKVTRSAIENAASIASLILTTEVVATEIKEKNPAPAGGGGDMGGMGGMY